MVKKSSYGKDGQLWEIPAVMEKTDSCRSDGHKAFKTIILTIISNLLLHEHDLSLHVAPRKTNLSIDQCWLSIAIQLTITL